MNGIEIMVNSGIELFSLENRQTILIEYVLSSDNDLVLAARREFESMSGITLKKNLHVNKAALSKKSRKAFGQMLIYVELDKGEEVSATLRARIAYTQSIESIAKILSDGIDQEILQQLRGIREASSHK